MKRFLFLACITAAIAFIAVPLPAIAKGGHGQGHDDDKHGRGKHGRGDDWKGHRSERGEWEDHRRHDDHGDLDGGGLNVTIDFGDRDYIRHYLSDSYRANCPPGLAKKHNGCLPPGQAKKRYMIGQPLPAGVFFEPVPMDMLGHLRPAPYGYRYVQVDQDVLLIGEATKHVVDAVTLLSAVGR